MGLAAGSSSYFIFVAAVFFVYWLSPQAANPPRHHPARQLLLLRSPRNLLPRVDPRLLNHRLPVGLGLMRSHSTSRAAS